MDGWLAGRTEGQERWNQKRDRKGYSKQSPTLPCLASGAEEKHD